MLYLLLPIIVLGHIAIHITVINRLHSTAISRRTIKKFDAVWYVFIIGTPLLIGRWYLSPVDGQPTMANQWLTNFVYGYLGLCCFVAGWAVSDRFYRKREIKTTELLIANHTHVVSMTKQLGHRPIGTWFTDFLSRLPLNEILHLSVQEKKLIVPRMNPIHDGLRITHLSDLHLTGQLGPAFYEEVVRQANEWESDIVAITGDIVEKEACLEWIQPTLGKLKANIGVFFVFGNHELRIKNESLIRSTLTSAGLIDMGRQWRQIEHAGRPVVMIGNELPWYKPAADLSNCPDQFDGDRILRILLTHSPDQLKWSRSHDCDLMLAGHTHGGQVRFPLIGPVLAPSNQGTRFASGTFYYPPTLMHVSRGIAGTRPLRLNCRPELARLVLCKPTSASKND